MGESHAWPGCLQACKDWSVAIEKTLPQRKVQKAKREGSPSTDGEAAPEAKLQRVRSGSACIDKTQGGSLSVPLE